jgi:hypothetical protein
MNVATRNQKLLALPLVQQIARCKQKDYNEPVTIVAKINCQGKYLIILHFFDTNVNHWVTSRNISDFILPDLNRLWRPVGQIVDNVFINKQRENCAVQPILILANFEF